MSETKLETEAEDLLRTMLRWFDDWSPGDLGKYPDDLLVYAKNWLQKIEAQRALGK